MIFRLVTIAALVLLLLGCQTAPNHARVNATAYLDYSSLDTQETGGTRMIPISTDFGNFQVYTRRVGNNPELKVLLLHGGPGGTHDVFLNFAGYLPAAGIEFYYYDQLGSFYSDQPDDDRLWTIPRFVEEVEQVRQALGLDKDNFYLYGQSWGGMLAMEYALAHQEHLKGLIISNMNASIPSYNEYARKVIMPGLNQAALAEIQALEAAEDYANPRYEALMFEHHYTRHILRKPLEEWPADVTRSFEHLNYSLYLLMQGPSELGARGRLVNWDRRADMQRITVPTLVMAAEYDTMNPAELKWMSEQMPQGQYHVCPDAGHIAQYDAPECYFPALIDFIREVNARD